MTATIEHDASGVGHCWRSVSWADVGTDDRLELAAATLEYPEGVRDYVTQSGQHYRWSAVTPTD